MIVAVDDSKITFDSMVCSTLKAAFEAGSKSVILLAGMRMGYMEPVGQSPEQGVKQILSGIKQAPHLDIHLVIPYPKALSMMRSRLQLQRVAA